MTDINDTTRVLRAVQTLVDKHLWFPTPEDRDATVLWTAGQWVTNEFQAFGRIFFSSSEPGSGKSEAMRVAARLSREEWVLTAPTPSVIYRIMDSYNEPVTIGLDEVDKLWGKGGSASSKVELVSVLNAGYEKSGYVGRSRGQTSVAKFRCYGPIAMAGLGTLPPDLLTRSITIPMQKAPKDVKVTPYMEDKHAVLFEGVRQQLEDWSRKVRNELSREPELPEGAVNRLRQIWTPLVSVADLANEDDWSVRARKALVTLSARKGTESSKSPTGAFLRVITNEFQTQDRLFTKDIAALMGDGFTTKQVGQICRDLDVVPRVMKIKGKSGTGVMKSDFEDTLTLLGKE